MITKKIMLYEDREDVFLTTYIWDESIELLYNEKRPCVLICPGGGYMNCSDREAEPVALKFASMGYHAIILRYSTYGERKGDFARLESDDPVKKHCLYPTQMRELGMAMLILGEHAEDWKLDMDKVVICGFSAGAHTCAMYANNWNMPIVYDYLKTSPEKLRPAAMILGYVPADYLLQQELLPENPELKKMQHYYNLVFLGATEPTKEQLAAVSPYKHITEYTPPAFLWTTAEDEVVPVQSSLRMAHALADHDIPFELHVFENGQHGLSVATQSSSGDKSWINDDVAKWTELADAWLKKRFMLTFSAVPWENRVENQRQSNDGGEK